MRFYIINNQYSSRFPKNLNFSQQLVSPNSVQAAGGEKDEDDLSWLPARSLSLHEKKSSKLDSEETLSSCNAIHAQLEREIERQRRERVAREAFEKEQGMKKRSAINLSTRQNFSQKISKILPEEAALLKAKKKLSEIEKLEGELACRSHLSSLDVLQARKVASKGEVVAELSILEREAEAARQREQKCSMEKKIEKRLKELSPGRQKIGSKPGSAKKERSGRKVPVLDSAQKKSNFFELRPKDFQASLGGEIVSTAEEATSIVSEETFSWAEKLRLPMEDNMEEKKHCVATNSSSSASSSEKKKGTLFFSGSKGAGKAIFNEKGPVQRAGLGFENVIPKQRRCASNSRLKDDSFARKVHAAKTAPKKGKGKKSAAGKGRWETLPDAGVNMFAFEARKDLLFVPPPPNSSNNSGGCNALLKEVAQLQTNWSQNHTSSGPFAEELANNLNAFGNTNGGGMTDLFMQNRVDIGGMPFLTFPPTTDKTDWDVSWSA